MFTDAEGCRDFVLPPDNPPNEEPEHQKDPSEGNGGGKSSDVAGLGVLRSP